MIRHDYTDWSRAQQPPRRLRDQLVAALSDAQFVAPATRTVDMFPDDQTTFFYVFDAEDSAAAGLKVSRYVAFISEFNSISRVCPPARNQPELPETCEMAAIPKTTGPVFAATSATPFAVTVRLVATEGRHCLIAPHCGQILMLMRVYCLSFPSIDWLLGM